MQTINIQQVMELLKEGAEKFCIYCDTQYWATQLLESAAQLKYKWIGGNNIGQTLWETYQENTCYLFNTKQQTVGYTDVNYAKKEHYIIYHLTDKSQNYKELIEHLNERLNQTFEMVEQDQSIVLTKEGITIFPESEQIQIDCGANVELVSKIQMALKSFKTPLYYILIDVADETNNNLPYLTKVDNRFEIVKPTSIAERPLKDLLFTEEEFNEIRGNNPLMVYSLILLDY